MPEVSTLNASTPAPAQEAHANPLDAILAAHGQQNAADEQETDDADDAADEQEAQDEKKLNALLRKAEKAFCKGNKGLLMSRVECGKWCHEIYVLRQEEGHKDRGFTSQIIFNRLAIHADSKRECDASELALMYEAVELLTTGDNWKALSVGKLIQLKKLETRVEGTETYGVFDLAKQEQAKALFAWACGDGLRRPSLDDITGRVIELMDPKKYAEREKQKAEKAAQAAEEGKDAKAADADEQEQTPAPENLISTDAARPAAPDWKDVPDGMAALYREGCKQQPGHQADMMRDFAKQFVWTDAMVKGLVAGMADSNDAESAQEAFQTLVDTIGDEYGIYPKSELEEAA